MKLARALFGLLLGATVLSAAVEGSAQYPEPRIRAWPDAVETASRLFEAGRWVEAVEAFEAAGRESPGPLPAEALRRWGVAASEGGRPLTAYVRLRQYLTTGPIQADRESIVERIGRARDALLVEAARFSRLVAMTARRPDEDSPGERHLVRVAARDGEASLEGMSGLHVDALRWRRAEEIPVAPFVDLVRRLLEAPALVDDATGQGPEPAQPAPRRTASLRLVIGEEERRVEAQRGEAYDRVRAAADTVIEFARTVPAVPQAPDVETKAPSSAPPPSTPPPSAPPPPRPAKKRR